jgi:hypothetical protein
MYFQKFYNVYQCINVDRNGRFQIQGGKKLDFTEINQCKQILLGLSLAGNLVKPLLSL